MGVVHVDSKVVTRYEIWCDDCDAVFAEFGDSKEAHERAAVHELAHRTLS